MDTGAAIRTVTVLLRGSRWDGFSELRYEGRLVDETVRVLVLVLVISLRVRAGFVSLLCFLA